MPNYVQEALDSGAERSRRGDTVTLRYNIYGMTDRGTAHLALIQNTPASIVAEDSGRTLVPESYRVTGQEENYWVGEVRYVDPGKRTKDPPETNDTILSFTIGGTNQHVEKSLETVVKATFDQSQPAPDFKQLIGVTKESVEGTDILVPEFTFQITKYVPLASITDAWVKSVADLVGTVADATFRGFPKGEVLLTSVSGSERSDQDAELTYQFARQKNTTVTIPGLQYFDGTNWTSSIPKKGWEYVWVYYEEAKDASSKRVIKVPKFAYVERVYEYGDFSILGL